MTPPHMTPPPKAQRGEGPEVSDALWELGMIVEAGEVEHVITCHTSQLADYYRDVCAKARVLVEARERIEAALYGTPTPKAQRGEKMCRT